MKQTTKQLIKKAILSVTLISSVSLLSNSAFARMEDDPVETKLMLDKFELGRVDGDTTMAWESGLWIGQDLNKFWLKSSGEQVAGKIEGTETQFLYSRALDPFWDIQAGIRHDTTADAKRNYLTLGIQGLAPYYFETDASLSFSKKGQVKLNAAFEYEMMLTQKLVLSPEVELNAYAKDDKPMGVASGLADVEAGIRLRYEIKREFAPYIGVNWAKKLGSTADLAKDAGEDTSESSVVLGIRAWY